MGATQIYNEPRYYEIAFSFVDVPKQIDLFELVVKKFGRKRTKNVLDICCGPSLQLPELARRGYFVAGLDANGQMLNYLEDKLVEQKAKHALYKQSMQDFTLNEKYDLAFCLMGSIHYLKSHQEYFSHLDCLAKAMKKGGLYIIENLPIFNRSGHGDWEVESEGLFIKTDYTTTVLNQIKQLMEHNFVMDIIKDGKKTTLKQRFITIFLGPQEFKLLVEQQGKFEFIGYFQRHNPLLLQLTGSNWENMTVIRRK